MTIDRPGHRWASLLAFVVLAGPAFAAAPPRGAGAVRRIVVPGPRGRCEPGEVAFSPDGRLLATWCNGSVVRVFDLKSDRAILALPNAGQWCEGLAFSPDGKFLACRDNIDLFLWSVPGAKRVALGDGIMGAVRLFSFLPHGRLAALFGSDRLYLINPRDGKHRLVARVGRGGRKRALTPRGDGALVIVWPSWHVGTIDLGTGKLSLTVLAGGPVKSRGGFIVPYYEGPALPLEKARLTPGGRGCAGLVWPSRLTPAVAWPPRASRPHILCRVEPKKGAPNPDAALAIACSPSGRLVAVGGTDWELHLYEMASGKLVATCQSAVGAVEGLAFSPDGQSLAVTRYESPAIEIRDITGMLGELPPATSAAARARCWSLLVSPGPLAGQRALSALARRPEADQLAEERLVLSVAGKKRVAQLVRGLDADQPLRREEAQNALATLGQAAGPALRRALQAKPSPEARRRLRALVEQLDGTAAWGAHGRALDLLERRATPAAVRVLKAIAAEKDGGWFSVEAREALERLKPRLSARR